MRYNRRNQHERCQKMIADILVLTNNHAQHCDQRAQEATTTPPTNHTTRNSSHEFDELMMELGMTIQHIHADMLLGNEAYIVHQTNCVTNTAAGLAKRIFTDLPYANVYTGRKHPSRPGSIRIMGDGKTRRFVVNLFGQFAPGKATPRGVDSAANRLRYFRQGLANLADHISTEHQGRTIDIAFPANIGCGMAGGDWAKYEKEITAFATNLYARGRRDQINIYHLNTSPSTAETASSKNFPPSPPREPNPVTMAPNTHNEERNPNREPGKQPAQVPNRRGQTAAKNMPSTATAKSTKTEGTRKASKTTTSNKSSGDRRPPEEWHPAKRAHYLDTDEYDIEDPRQKEKATTAMTYYDRNLDQVVDFRGNINIISF